jgi:hypothetical protein
MAGGAHQQVVVVLAMVALMVTAAEGFISKKTWSAIRRADRDGPFVGLVVPNTYEMDPVLSSPDFKPSNNIPILDVQGNLAKQQQQTIMRLSTCLKNHD